MKIPELARPIFLFVATFRRKIRHDVPLDYSEVKREILSLFARLEAQASSKALTDRWNRAKIALAYLVDEVATMETWSGQDNWTNHSLEVELLGHDVQMRGVWFFDRELQHAMDTSDLELTEVLYTCLCLGFEGRFRDQTAQLKNHMDNLFARLPIPYEEDGPEAKLFADCYHVDKTRNDPKMPMRVATVVAVFLGIIATYFVASYAANQNFVNRLAEIQQTVTDHPFDSPQP